MTAHDDWILNRCQGNDQGNEEPTLEICPDCGDEFWLDPNVSDVCPKCDRSSAITPRQHHGTTITDLERMVARKMA